MSAPPSRSERQLVPPLAWYGVSWAADDPPAEPEPPKKKPAAKKVGKKAGGGGPAGKPKDFGEDLVPGTGTGVVFGRFMPPHRGHQFVVEFARRYVSALAVVLQSAPADPIPADYRAAWLGELFPWAKLIHVQATPPDPVKQRDELSKYWGDVFRANGVEPQFLFGSDAHNEALAGALGVRYVPVDPGRTTVPISGTQIREEPGRHTQFLPPCVRPYFIPRVCLIGPESTGKTTLARRLAEHYGTVAVPEYARTMLDAARRDWAPADVQFITRGQITAEAALVRQATRVLFCDTCALQVMLWSRRLFGDCPPVSRAAAEGESYDLYLLTEADVPFSGDPARDRPEERAEFGRQCLDELTRRGKRFAKVSGTWDERLRLARGAVDELLAAKPMRGPQNLW